MPRRFSSGSRSVSTPVRARTSDVLPWSMWPAVPRIMRAASPPLLLPELHRAQRPAVREMLGEKLAQEALVRAPRRVVELDVVAAGEEEAERAARLCRQDAAGRREPPAARAERAAGGMTEHDRRVGGERGMTFRADVHRGTEPQLGDDVPRAGERRREGGGPRRAGQRIERI